MRSLGLRIVDDYRPSDGELDNLVFLTLKYTIGWPMRQADKAVILQFAGDDLCGDAGISRVVEQACEYAWDHICGKPEDFDTDTLFDHIRPILNEWYDNSNVEQRSDTSPEVVQ